MCYGDYIVKATPAHRESRMDTPHAIGPVVGLENIGKLFDRSRYTVARWIADYDFPAAQLPNGQWATSHSLIDEWLFPRSEGQRGG